MKRERERKKGEGFAFGMRRLLRVSSPSLYCRLALSCCVVLCSFNLPLSLSQRQRVIDFLNRASERRRTRRRSEGWAIHKALFSRNLNCVKSPPLFYSNPQSALYRSDALLLYIHFFFCRGVTITTGSVVMLLLLLLEDEFTQPTQLRQRT